MHGPREKGCFSFPSCTGLNAAYAELDEIMTLNNAYFRRIFNSVNAFERLACNSGSKMSPRLKLGTKVGKGCGYSLLENRGYRVLLPNVRYIKYGISGTTKEPRWAWFSALTPSSPRRSSSFSVLLSPYSRSREAYSFSTMLNVFNTTQYLVNQKKTLS